MALLSYWATLIPWCGLSPAELLMGRRIRTDVAQVATSFIPKWPHTKNFRNLDETHKRLQKEYYDKCHRVMELPPEDQRVWVDTRGDLTPARVLDTPRSYVVETSSGQLRRNCSHLRIQPSSQETALPAEPPITPHRPVTRSQTGTTVGPPD